ncbi:MAG: hypothetical protein Q7S27_02210 [Nanoarchaeota archaeon]|nr:hypothetical protein [Nanoarchaeota archaeon]
METNKADKIKNFIKYNGNSKKYSFYEIGGEVKDMGINFGLNRAAKSYLENHHCGRYKLLGSSSKRSDYFSLIIAVEDDLHIEELKHSIDNSGRQPTKKNLKAEVEIKSINPTEILVNGIEECYAEKLRVKEQEIDSLKSRIDDKAKSLEDKEKRINSLELEIKNRPKEKFNSLLEAVLDGYIGNNDELMYNFIEDYKKLKENSDVDLFLKESSGISEFSYLTYLKRKYNLGFSSEQELSSFLQKREEEKDWSMVQRGKELKELERLHMNDRSLLELVKLSGFTDELISSVKGVVEKNRLAEVQELIKAYKNQFDSEKRVYEKIKSSRGEYEDFKGVLERAVERKSEKLPVLIHKRGERLKIYTPLALGDEALQMEMGEVLSYNLIREPISLIPKIYSENVGEFNILVNPSLGNTGLNNLAKRIFQLLKQNDIINALAGGVNPYLKVG